MRDSDGDLTWFGRVWSRVDASKWVILDVEPDDRMVVTFDPSRTVRFDKDHYRYRAWFRYDYDMPQHLNGSEQFLQRPPHSHSIAQVEVDCAELSTLILGMYFYDRKDTLLWSDKDLPNIVRERQTLVPGEEGPFEDFCKRAKGLHFESR
jgi:hypothetical protein